MNFLHDTSRVVVANWWFDVGISMLILVNAVLIGVEQQLRNDGADTTAVAVAESVFLVIYTSEVVLRFFATNGVCLTDRWLVFEATLVMFGLAEFIGPLMFEDTNLSAFGVMRVLSILRTFRMVRLFRRFKALWKLLHSFLDSLITLGWILIMLALVLYVFACIGMQIISAHPLRREDEAFAEAVDKFFPHLWGTMLTLVQFVTLDNASEVYKPLVKADVRLAGYFLSLILIVSIALMNLVTAAIVNTAMEQAAKDKELARLEQEQERKAMIKKLGKLFKRIDSDDSGFLSLEELLNMTESQHREIQDVLQVEDPQQIFKELDENKDGRVPLAEFCKVLWQESNSKVPAELRRIDKGFSFMRKEFEKMRSEVRAIESPLSPFSAPGKLPFSPSGLKSTRSFSSHTIPSSTLKDENTAKTKAFDEDNVKVNVLLDSAAENEETKKSRETKKEQKLGSAVTNIPPSSPREMSGEGEANSSSPGRPPSGRSTGRPLTASRQRPDIESGAQMTFEPGGDPAEQTAARLSAVTNNPSRCRL
eukprot:TRINITY_DN38570_c0_g1_i4.p1 TRINITY_DN38570_c0_g1~~TRINITY_DN38570_c0_g1_i4.p1  ORF type:complete len:619 (+),score=117.55 TRINITY_DN38570_c0_g1_i4:252-1859(+)